MIDNFSISVGEGSNDLLPTADTATFKFTVEVSFRIHYEGMRRQDVC